MEEIRDECDITKYKLAETEKELADVKLKLNLN